MKRIYKYLSHQEWLYRFAVRLIAYRISTSAVSMKASDLAHWGREYPSKKLDIKVEFRANSYNIYQNGVYITTGIGKETLENYLLVVDRHYLRGIL